MHTCALQGTHQDSNLCPLEADISAFTAAKLWNAAASPRHDSVVYHIYSTLRNAHATTLWCATFCAIGFILQIEGKN